MTKIMQNEIRLYWLLKILGYTFGILGIIGIWGFVGSLEKDVITMSQCIVYEFLAFGLIGLSYVMFRVRELIKRDFNRRRRYIAHSKRAI